MARFTLKLSINFSASKSCLRFNSKISFVFKFFPCSLLNLLAKPRPEIKLSISASLALLESKFSFFAAKYGI
jgi:hypothetical protein